MSDEEVNIDELNKEQVDAELDKIMDTRENILWQLVDLQMRTCELYERMDALEETQN
jgi:hypothetical protein